MDLTLVESSGNFALVDSVHRHSVRKSEEGSLREIKPNVKVKEVTAQAPQQLRFRSVC